MEAYTQPGYGPMPLAYDHIDLPDPFFKKAPPPCSHGPPPPQKQGRILGSARPGTIPALPPEPTARLNVDQAPSNSARSMIMANQNNQDGTSTGSGTQQSQS